MRRPHLFVTKLPDRIVERGLLAGFLDCKDCAVKQLEAIGEVLAQSDLIVKGRKQHSIFSWPDNGLNEVHRRFLFELQFAGSRGRGVHQHANVKWQVVVLFAGERIDLLRHFIFSDEKISGA